VSDKPIFNVNSFNQSGGITAGQVVFRPQRRDLSHPGTRQTLLDRIPRGATFDIYRVNDAEAAAFANEQKDFLVSEGRIARNDIIVLDKSFYGQNIGQKDGVYFLEIGADNGVRGP
jgi:hypothetical protein